MAAQSIFSEYLLDKWKILACIISGLLVFLYTAQTIYVWYRLRHIPGPFWVGFSKWWLLRSHYNGRNHLELAEICEKYGKLARIGPNDLVTSDPHLLRRMLGVRTPYTRSVWYEGLKFDPSHENMLSQRDHTEHATLRAQMAAGYAGKENDNIEQTVDENIAALVKLIDSKYISTATEYKPMDLGRKASFFTIDVISSLAFGKAFGDLERDEDVHKYIEMLDETGPAIMLIALLPWVQTLLQLPILKGFLPSAKDKFGFGKVMGVAKEIAEERFGPNKKVKRDMIGSFIAHGLTQDEIESEILVQILAGSDTTATAIRVIMLYITTSPRMLNTLLAEITAFAPSSPITDAEARKMPYLQAIIKEGLRIWPPVIGLSSKEVPKGGDVINGIFVPGGTNIGYAAWGLFRSKEIWGADADQFRPERWLSGDVRVLKEMDATWELNFSYGRWQCLGKNVAMLELNKVIVELVRNFEFGVTNPTRPWKSICAGVFLQSEMWMRVTRREKKL